MTRKVFVAILAVVALLLAGGCWKSSQEKAEEKMKEAQAQAEQAQEKMKENLPQGLDQMTEAMEKMGEAMNAAKVDPVDFRELKSLLPETVGPLKRTEASGEKTAQMGIKVSTAHGVYERGEEPGRIELKIVDLGTMKGFAAIGTYAWTVAQVDQESDTEYEKTTTYAGCKAYEKYNREGKHGEMQVLVADRFVVEVNGSDVSMDEIKSALGAVDIGKLKSMKNVGVQPQ